MDKLFSCWGNCQLTRTEVEYLLFLFSYPIKVSYKMKDNFSFPVAIKMHLLPLHYIENKDRIGIKNLLMFNWPHLSHC